MTKLPLILLFVSGVAFTLATWFSVRYLKYRRNDDGFWASSAAFGGYMAFTFGGLIRIGLAGFFPYGSFADALLVLVWVVITTYMALELRWQIKGAGAYLFPVVAMMSLYALTLPASGAMALPILRSPVVIAHVSLVLGSYATFGLAALMGALYLMQERQLKSKRLTFMHYSLPDLSTLARLDNALLLSGFPLLTVGIAFGSYWANHVWGSFLPSDPKLIWALLNWCFYAVFLATRQWRGVSSHMRAMLAVVGFVAIIVNYFGTSFLISGLHRFF